MPPAAISRSSTYFPKICGNIACDYRSAFPRLLLGLPALFVGCGPLEPNVEFFEIRSNSLDASARCRIDTNPDVTLQALGPFPVSLRGAERLPFRTPDRTLTFPDDTEGVEAAATDFNRTWLGYSDRRTAKGIDVLLWEDSVGCEVFDATLQAYPGRNAGQAVGHSLEAGVVLVAGGDVTVNTSGSAGGSLVFETGSGKSSLVETELGFPQARAYATVTPFGSGLLLAGGENPLDGAPDVRRARATAAVYDPDLGGFDSQTIELDQVRTRHAAVVLPSGETLLVGGSRPSDFGQGLVTAFEAVSPRTRHSRVNGLASLASGRIEPTALSLEDGRILVGGGYDVSRAPVTSLEWFSRDGACRISPSTSECTSDPETVNLEARHHRAFVALPGGGALTVGGCAPSSVQNNECEIFCGVGFGCPAPTADAEWIAPDGQWKTIGIDRNESCTGPEPVSPEWAFLAPGSDGAPWLVAYDEDRSPPCRAVFRFAPWADPPAFVPATVSIEHWPDRRIPLTSLGPDAFVWLSEDDPPFLVGMRAGVRGALSQNETLLVPNPEAPLTPPHLAPDRGTAASTDPTALFRHEGDGFRLILEVGPVRVFITDTRYDDVTVSIGFSISGPPVLLLGSYEIGGNDCPWPDSPVSPLRVTRQGGVVTTSDSNGKKTSCKNSPRGTLSLGFASGATTATITSLSVKRR